MPAPSVSPDPAAHSSIPRATARLQLHRDFRFEQAAATVDYYHRLGISHFYLSPILVARHQNGRKIEVADAQAVVVVHRRGRLLEAEITVQLQPRGGARDAAVRRGVWRYGRGWHQISLAVPPRTRRRRSSLALAA